MKLTRDEFNELIKRRPHLVGVGGLQNPVRKPAPLQTLDHRAQSSPKGKTSFSGCHVTIVSLRRRIVDDDNLIAGAKALRDAIAEHLGIDDSKINWEYLQLKTSGDEGTIVKITSL